MRGRAYTLALVAILASACGGAVPSGSGSPSGSAGQSGSGGPSAPAGSGARLTPGPYTDAPSAAAAVINAKDDDARTVAVLSILQAIGVGVYTPDGDPLVVGAERWDEDFWMYDFQASALAASVRDGDAIRLDDIAADLVEIAAANGGGAVTVENILGAVAASAAEVKANPSLDRGLALGVALELGRQGRFHTDLASPVKGEPIVLDGLSAFLVTADLVLPVIATQEVAVAGGRTASLAQVPPVPYRCLHRGMGGGNGWIAGVAAGRVGGLAGVTNASFDRYLQGQLTGGTVEAKLEGPPSWHHRHEDSNGTVDGEEQEYFFSIRLRTSAPTTPIRCGPLTSTFFPSEGEIVGADVRWSHPRLIDHGTIISETQTSAQGTAKLTVDPRTERHPAGIGPLKRERITMTAQVNVLRALGGDLYTHLAGVPALQRRSLDIDVEWHRTYAVDVDVASILTVTKGATYKGELGVTTASGVIPVVEFRNAADPPRHAGGQILNPGILMTSADPARTQGRCNTEWILAKSGASRDIDWQVFDLAIWPPDEISLQMDTGPVYEEPDYYDGLLCPPGGQIRLGPSPGNVWETMIFLSYPPPGGLKLKGLGPKKWQIDSSPDVWDRGGDLATWHSEESCGGRCTGVLEITVRIRPLP